MDNNSNNIRSNYPTMSDSEWDNAPFNSKKGRVIPVTVSITMSKQVYITVDDYKVIEQGKNEDGSSYEEIECDDETLKQAVEEQINLPKDAGKLFKNHDHYPPYSRNKIYKDLKGWCIDDFEVIQD